MAPDNNVYMLQATAERSFKSNRVSGRYAARAAAVFCRLSRETTLNCHRKKGSGCALKTNRIKWTGEVSLKKTEPGDILSILPTLPLHAIIAKNLKPAGCLYFFTRGLLWKDHLAVWTLAEHVSMGKKRYRHRFPEYQKHISHRYNRVTWSRLLVDAICDKCASICK